MCCSSYFAWKCSREQQRQPYEFKQKTLQTRSIMNWFDSIRFGFGFVWVLVQIIKIKRNLNQHFVIWIWCTKCGLHLNSAICYQFTSFHYFLFKFQSIFVIIAAAVDFIIITKRKNGNISNNNIAASDCVSCRSLPPMHQSKLLIQQHTIHLKIPIVLIICTQFANVSFHQFCSLSLFSFIWFSPSLSVHRLLHAHLFAFMNAQLYRYNVIHFAVFALMLSLSLGLCYYCYCLCVQMKLNARYF